MNKKAACETGSLFYIDLPDNIFIHYLVYSINTVMFQTPYLIISTLLITCFASCAQNNHLSDGPEAVSFATVTEQMPGNIPVDANGNDISAPRAKKYIVYLNSPSSGITWEDAWIGAKHYSLESEVIETFPFNAGTDKSTNEKILLTKKKDTRVWILKLHPAYDEKPAPNDVSGDEIILQGSKDGKKVTRQIKHIIEIEAIPAA